MAAVDADERDDELLGRERPAEAVVSLSTHGDPLRSFAQLLSAVVDECCIRFDEDGLHVCAIDPARVCMIRATFPAEGLARYHLPDGDEVTFGLNLARFRRTLRWARKGRGSAEGDPVVLDLFDDPDRVRVRIAREDSRMVRRSEWFGIDPDAIRAEPNVPDLTLPNRARPGVSALKDAVGAVGAEHDHAAVTRDGETFVVESHGDDDQDRVTILGCAWDDREEDAAEACSSLFSIDYLDDLVRSMEKAKVDDVTVKWADEFPTKLQFQSEDWGFSGVFMLAPRIQAED